MNRRCASLARLAALGLFSVAVLAQSASEGRTGPETDGRTTLPTEWHLSPPAGGVQSTGTLPESATPTGDGAHLIVVDAGAGPARVDVLNARSLAVERTIAMEGAYGVPEPEAGGTAFWVSTGQLATIVELDAASGATLRTIALPPKSWASSIARSPDGTHFAVSDETSDRLLFVDLASGTVRATPAFGAHLGDARFSRDGKTVYVASWGGASVFAVDAATLAVRTEIPTGRHPEHLALSPDGAALYASETDDDAIAVIDTASDRVARTIPIGLYDGKISGASPTSLALDASGRRLYVACSAANAIAVLATDGAYLGAIPTGWYPTYVGLDRDGRALVVADGMGESGRANPQFQPFVRGSPGYVAKNMIGSIRRVPIPADADLARGTADVYRNGGPFLGAALADPAVLAGGPRPPAGAESVVRPNGPIRHVIYVIKENRTYDQVLGDESSADGDAKLTLFGREVTPNEHAIAERFGIFDRTFADAEVSADGHNWSTAAFANDYLEKMWPPNYGGRREIYDFEDGATASVPHAGYLWNLAKRYGVSLRNYGEFTSEPDETAPVAGEKVSKKHTGITSSMPDLEDETDPRFPGFDLDVSDLSRLAEWQREYERDLAHDTMPSIEIVRMPNDHTAGTRRGELTPSAFVAQNDDAIGRLVDVVSHGKDWSSTAIFVLEDDAQNGADHVDAQRMTFYLASPYAAGGVQHEHYSTAGVLRTIEMLFGLPPMSAYDAAARPLTAAFTTQPNLTPFDAKPETHGETETNAATAYHGAENARHDLSRADVFPEAELNDEIWHAVSGHAAPAAAVARTGVR